jgi:hypothetical protein
MPQPDVGVLPEGPNVRRVVLEARVIDRGDDWYTKDEILRMEHESQQFWTKLTDDQRAAARVMVRDTLVRLLEDPDVWLPTTFIVKPQLRMDVYLSIHFGEVDDEVIRRRMAAENALQETRSDLVTLHKELGEGERPPGD